MAEHKVYTQCGGQAPVLLVEADSPEDALAQVQADRDAGLKAEYRSTGGPVELDWTSPGVRGVTL